MVHPGKETAIWSTITPDMMSDEENDGESYVRHPPGILLRRSSSANSMSKQMPTVKISCSLLKGEMISKLSLIPMCWNWWCCDYTPSSPQMVVVVLYVAMSSVMVYPASRVHHLGKK